MKVDRGFPFGDAKARLELGFTIKGLGIRYLSDLSVSRETLSQNQRF
jgi:hypothetical protein